ncbi:hypothetical protein J1614_002995 [Plenodomus biglobosus]|nr:hypothetical protein J1614_002995 [Plenodomus biglobosus]
MGLPYSRQINAAFEQVTPLVAAGFKVLRTTRDISILLAVIQVLTVWLLFLILVGVGCVLVCVNPDMEVWCLSFLSNLPVLKSSINNNSNKTQMKTRSKSNEQDERRLLITPWLKRIAQITLWSVVKTGVCFAALLGAVAWVGWRGMVAKRWVEDVEFEGNVEAERALEEVDGQGEGEEMKK